MSANGKKIAAAALSGLMAMGTLPVAALADTAVETQARADYSTLVNQWDLSFTYHGHDYTQKDGDTLKLTGDEYDPEDYRIELKSVGSLTFEETDSYSGYTTFNVKNGDDSQGTAYAHFITGATGNLMIEVHYGFDNGTFATTTINLDVDYQNYADFQFEKVDEGGNYVTSLGTPTYNGSKQYFKLFDDGVAVDSYSIVSVPTGVTNEGGGIISVTNAGTYSVRVQATTSNAGGTTTTAEYNVPVTVAKFDLANATVYARDFQSSIKPTSLVVNGEQVSGTLAGLLKVETGGASRANSDQTYTVTYDASAATDNNVVYSTSASQTVTARQVTKTHDVSYNGTTYGVNNNGGQFVFDLSGSGPANVDDDDCQFDPDDLKALSGDELEDVVYVNLDTKATTTDYDDVKDAAGHFMAIAQVKRDASNTKGGTVYFKFTNVKASKEYRVSVYWDGQTVNSTTNHASTEYTGDAINPTVTVYDDDGKAIDSSRYTVTLQKINAGDGSRADVTEIRDAGYYRVVVTMKDGSALSGGDSITYLTVEPATLEAQVSDEGQVKDDSTDPQSDSHFAYTGSAVSPKIDFFKQDDDGDYAKVYKTVTTGSGSSAYTTTYSRIYKYSDLTEAQKARLQKSDRYSKVDVDSSTYTVKYFDSGNDLVDAADLKDKGTYRLAVYDSTLGVTDNYTFSNDYSSFRISDERTYFDDVASDAWYAQVVNDAHSKGYVNGYAGTRLYGPENTITRADVACILYNVAGKTGADTSYTTDTDKATDSGFSDVNSGAYYAAAVTWARKAGVVNGYGDGTFRPDQDVTREEFAAMLANYAKLVRNYEAGSTSELDAFPDGSAVSDWAKDVVAWAVHNKVMGNGGFINPQGSITRAETAAMVMNFDAIKR